MLIIITTPTNSLFHTSSSRMVELELDNDNNNDDTIDSIHYQLMYVVVGGVHIDNIYI